MENDALIVGGGPAGSCTAWALATAGLRVTVIDRARFPRDKPCAEYLSPQASRILDEMGVLDAVERAGAAQLSGMIVHAPSGRKILGEFASSHGFRGFRDRGLALRRTVLDSILLDRAREAGANVREGVKAVDVIRAADGRVTGLAVDERGSSRRVLSARLVVGADGLRSVVGRRVARVRTARWPRRIAFVSHYSGVAGIGPHGEMHVDREGYLGLADVGSGITNVALVVPASRVRATHDSPAHILAAWIGARPSLARRFERAAPVTPARATGPFASSCVRAAGPGYALVGDAAEFFDPFTGEGIYAALRGGELLASHATRALREDSSAGCDAVMSGYDETRRREFSGKWRVEKLIGCAVAFPTIMNHAARVLEKQRDMADLLVGVTGDFVPAAEVLRAGYLMRFLFPSWRSRARVS